jgi:hypothetical protein
MNFQKAISEARSLEEVERLKAMLQSGQMPGSMDQNGHGNSMEHQQNMIGKNFDE